MDCRAVFQGKKVFLTGHTGFKGAWLAEWLLQSGAKVTGFSLDIPTTPALFEELQLAKRLEDQRGDINDFLTLKNSLTAAKPEVVFHLAAQPLVRLSYDQPLLTFATNVMGTAHLLEAVRATPSVSAVVVVTTDKVYENLGTHAFRESDPLGGHDPYSASKAGTEIVFSSYQRSFFSKSHTRLAAARAGNVIGGGDWALDRIVPDCIRAWEKGEKVTLRNPHSVRPWQHVLEPLSGYLLLAARLLENPEGVQGEAFNFGPTDALDRPTLALVEELEKQWPGAGHRIEAVDDGKKEAAYLRLNCDKAAERLQWVPKLPFAETAAWTSAWYYRKSERADFTQEQIRQYEALLRGP